MRRLVGASIDQRGPIASALRTSAGLPDSGLTFVDNSQGGSAAVAELSTALDSALDKIDWDNDLGEQLRGLCHRLDEEASKFDSSKLSQEDGASDTWVCSRDLAHVVSAAWKCARGAYEPNNSIADTEWCSFRRVRSVSPSLDGAVKALTATAVKPNLEWMASKNPLLPVLIIAIRGSASRMDHLVNANGEPKDARHLAPDTSCEPGFEAHGGLLSCAHALQTVVSQSIDAFRNSNIQDSYSHRKCHVLFTGHSAGGAVASLLFLKFLREYEPASNMQWSLITFGAPPCVTSPVDLSALQSAGRVELCLNLINEFDVVSRADGPYILCLVDLIRSLCGQPPLQGERESVVGAASTASGSLSSSPASTGVWPVPKPLYYHVGRKVIFMIRLQGSEVQMNAVEVPHDKFGTLLFCRIAVHRRVCYSERIQLLEDGMLNGLRCWESESEDDLA